MKLYKILIMIIILSIFVASSLFYIPFKQYGVVTSPNPTKIDLSKYSIKEYYNIYNLPNSKYIKIKPSGQLNFEKVELKHKILYEELILRCVIMVMLLIIIWNAMPNKITYEPNKPYPMKWYKYLIAFFIPLWLIASPILTYININTRILNYYGNWENYLSELPNILSFSIYLINLLLLLIAYIELRKYSKRGYIVILCFFIIAAIYPILEMFIYAPSYLKANIQFDYVYLIGRAFGGSLFYIPNIIYFTKRKHMFIEENEENYYEH